MDAQKYCRTNYVDLSTHQMNMTGSKMMQQSIFLIDAGSASERKHMRFTKRNRNESDKLDTVCVLDNGTLSIVTM